MGGTRVPPLVGLPWVAVLCFLGGGSVLGGCDRPRGGAAGVGSGGGPALFGGGPARVGGGPALFGGGPAPVGGGLALFGGGPAPVGGGSARRGSRPARAKWGARKRGLTPPGELVDLHGWGRGVRGLCTGTGRCWTVLPAESAATPWRESSVFLCPTKRTSSSNRLRPSDQQLPGRHPPHQHKQPQHAHTAQPPGSLRPGSRFPLRSPDGPTELPEPDVVD